VQVVGDRREQHPRPGWGSRRGCGLAEHPGRDVREQVLDCDAVGQLRPAVADRAEHRAYDGHPGAAHVGGCEVLAQQGAHVGAVEIQRRSADAVSGRVGALGRGTS
jgi:hypothetical protein